MSHSEETRSDAVRKTKDACQVRLPSLAEVVVNGFYRTIPQDQETAMLKFIANLFARSAPKSPAANTTRLELNSMEDRMAPARIAVPDLSNTTIVRTVDDGPSLSPQTLNYHNYEIVTGFFGQ